MGSFDEHDRKATEHTNQNPFRGVEALHTVTETGSTLAEGAHALATGETLAESIGEFRHILGGGGFSAAGPAQTALTAANAVLAPLNLFVGGEEIVSGLRHGGPEGTVEAIHGGLVTTSGASTLAGLVASGAGASSVGGAMMALGPLFSAAALGVAGGHALDEKLHLSDKFSDLMVGSTEDRLWKNQHQIVSDKRGTAGIAEANARWWSHNQEEVEAQGREAARKAHLVAALAHWAH
jgi:hypothetical protein